MLNISEIFYSIQGEGLMAGVPSMFIRFSGCNLRCTWCDTPYTSWKPEGMDVYMGALLANVRKQYCGHVVVTGGEPMIQPDIELLCEGLRGIDQHITMETNGTVFKKLECDLMSISPKLKNSTPVKKKGGKYAEKHEEIRYQPEVLKELIATYPNYQLKFVVSDRADMEEVKGIVDELRAERSRVLLMPEGTKPKDLRDRSEWMVEACKFFNYRYAPRLHVQLWGNKRGV